MEWGILDNLDIRNYKDDSLSKISLSSETVTSFQKHKLILAQKPSSHLKTLPCLRTLIFFKTHLHHFSLPTGFKECMHITISHAKRITGLGKFSSKETR